MGKLPEGTPPPRIDHLSFGWELVRDLVTPLILQRMKNDRYVVYLLALAPVLAFAQQGNFCGLCIFLPASTWIYAAIQFVENENLYIYIYIYNFFRDCIVIFKKICISCVASVAAASRTVPSAAAAHKTHLQGGGGAASIQRGSLWGGKIWLMWEHLQKKE